MTNFLKKNALLLISILYGAGLLFYLIYFIGYSCTAYFSITQFLMLFAFAGGFGLTILGVLKKNPLFVLIPTIIFISYFSISILLNNITAYQSLIELYKQFSVKIDATDHCLYLFSIFAGLSYVGALSLFVLSYFFKFKKLGLIMLILFGVTATFTLCANISQIVSVKDNLKNYWFLFFSLFFNLSLVLGLGVSAHHLIEE